MEQSCGPSHYSSKTFNALIKVLSSLQIFPICGEKIILIHFFLWVEGACKRPLYTWLHLLSLTYMMSFQSNKLFINLQSLLILLKLIITHSFISSSILSFLMFYRFFWSFPLHFLSFWINIHLSIIDRSILFLIFLLSIPPPTFSVFLWTLLSQLLYHFQYYMLFLFLLWLTSWRIATESIGSNRYPFI